jgi:glycosyltransferase involved in cell wall biosynthesis
VVSVGEGWGLPIAEAMAMGMPVIVSNCSGPAAYANHTNAFMISVDDTLDENGYARPLKKSLIEHMKYVYSNLSEAKRVGLRGRDTMVMISAELVVETMKERIIENVRMRGFNVVNN